MTTDSNLALRCLYRYKLCFVLGLLILSIQVFLAYKSLEIPDISATIESHRNWGSQNSNNNNNNGNVGRKQGIRHGGDTNPNSVNDDEEQQHSNAALVSAQQQEQHQQQQQKHSQAARSPTSGGLILTPEQLGFLPECEISAKEAISALQRAKTKDCRKHIAQIACAIQAGHFYERSLPNHCPSGNHTANAPLGCYQDEKEFRLLPGYFINFKQANSPTRCINLCLQSGFPYAGVQYGSECFCGVKTPSSSAQLADSKCNMKCTGDAKEVCGGYFTMNIYETGIAKFSAQIAETSVKADDERVRIAFLLTLNGRALRQVHRLIRSLYAPQHVFYIHVDARQDYLYRKLLELEGKFTNIRLARNRHSTIWGGASLLTMLLECMSDLLASNWQWDFVINLSESDYPVKTAEKLVDFLTANRGRNFVKSHGRETQRFIQKQGLDKTFVECDTHMWRIGDRVLPTGIQMDGGSDWVALSRPFVDYVTAGLQRDGLLQGLLTIFRHTLLPAESFFHTVLRNSRFCNTYVDNNLHVTNWKRKLGCKCQYKHVVDWCGCSPNDFKPDDWARLQGTEHKMLFFARKFEPIINQAVLRQLEEWLYGAHMNGPANVNGYWQSLYHAEDAATAAPADDLTRTVGESVLRLMGRKLNVQPQSLIEMTTYMHNDQYKGFLVHYAVRRDNVTLEYETRVRPVQYAKMAKNSKLAKRIRQFEVSSDFDQKEQVARNYAKILGPYTELVVTFTFVGAGGSGGPSSAQNNDAAHSYNLTLLWIDPMGRLQDFNELHIEDSQTDAINFSKSLLRQPITPGIWTVKLIGRSAIYAQTKFLVSPLALWSGLPIRSARALAVNAGAGHTLPADFELPAEWQQHLPSDEDAALMQRHAAANAQRIDTSLHSWIDELVSKFFHVRETCAHNELAAVQVSTAAVHELPLCEDTPWSSMAPDPKSDIDALLPPASLWPSAQRSV